MARNKAVFFNELDKLDNLSDGEDVADNFSQVMKTVRERRSSAVSTTRASASTLVTPGRVSRIESASPRPSLANIGTNETRLVKETPCEKLSDKQKDNLEMKRSWQSSNLGGDKERLTSKKRRASSFKTVPELQKIFKGLKFFFVPNDDVAPARRMRIQKTQEYGAIWARNWTTDITHVIVDKDIHFQDVLRVLKLDQFPPNVALVNQDYPSECLKFQSILSVTQTRFLVNGAPGATTDDTPALPDPAPEDSLPLKPPRRRGQRSPTPTPEEDSQRQARVAQAVAETSEKQLEGETSHHSRPGTAPDILDELMEKVKAAGDLPLEESDDEEAILETSLDSDSELRKSDQKIPEWQKSFACMQKHDGNSDDSNPNARTIEILQQMSDYYSRTADHWRTIAYRKAINALRKQQTRISTKAQALAIAGIGERLADKIEEIVCTDRLRRLENTSLTSEDKALQLFLGVYGAGFTQASRWIAMGYRTLEDLRTKADLSRNQRIGVERYDDFQQRIPRAEVEAHGNIVREAVQRADADMEVILAGSYRRGAADSGDIDVLITKPGATMECIRSIMMNTVVPRLFDQGFLKVSLATSSRNDGSKWHGASALPGSDVWRRIDLLFVPGDEIGAALLYFTGNDIFNRSIRLLASKKGMCLNQHGLYKAVLRGRHRVKANPGCLVEGRDEKRIFEVLGVPWRPPEHRIC
ncbi:hypothetical protein VTN77DRAFT_4403 [Rasamsonia byssochlamydoides]|uniref:uncharacterized protein n=1 Tax=Rasamsonia byssochlamydoides TaxID=89139 RepID=UPI003742B8BE